MNVRVGGEQGKTSGGFCSGRIASMNPVIPSSPSQTPRECPYCFGKLISKDGINWEEGGR